MENVKRSERLKLTLKWFVFCVFLGAFCVQPFLKSLREANQFKNIKSAGWQTTNCWLQSAYCAKETGILLAVACDGKPEPYESISLADDPGHALLLGIYSSLKSRPMTCSDVHRLNMCLNFMGSASMALLLFIIGAPLASFLFLVLSGPGFFSWAALQPHPSYVGVSMLATLLPIAFWGWHKGLWGKIKTAIIMALGFGGLAIAALIRQPIGIMGAVVSVATLAIISLRLFNNPRRLLAPFLLAVLTFLFWQTPRWVYLARDAVWGLNSSSLHKSHGISHTLYVGLGAVENSLGIRWLDEFGRVAVDNINPKIAYCSEEYYQMLWKLYFKQIAQNPAEVIRIYSIKLWKIICMHFPQKLPSLGLMLIAFVILLGCACKRGGRSFLRFEIGLSLSFFALAFICLFITQGMLAHFDYLYTMPIGAYVGILVGISGELFLRSRLSLAVGRCLQELFWPAKSNPDFKRE